MAPYYKHSGVITVGSHNEKKLQGAFGCNQDLKGSLFCCPAGHLSAVQSKRFVSFTAGTQ